MTVGEVLAEDRTVNVPLTWSPLLPVTMTARDPAGAEGEMYASCENVPSGWTVSLARYMLFQ